MITLREVALLRVLAQRLVGTPLANAAEAARWSTCTQAQDLSSALTSVALRTATRSRAAVTDALDAGEIVRSWPMRGTLHLTAAEDLPWLLRLLAPRIVRSTTGRRTGLGLDEAQLRRGRDLTVAALEGGRSLSRAALFDVWRRSGLDPAGQRGVHLLSWLAMTGTVVLGPLTGREQHVVLLEEWVPHPRDLDDDQALGELAVRYFASHGPAPATDLTHWARLTVAQTRTAVALARPSLDTVDVEGAEHLLDPATPDLLREHRAQAEGVLALPGFDELVLGHRDRRAQLEPEHAETVVPGGNGVFRPTVVHAGRVVGTWSRGRSTNLSTPSATPFTRFTPQVQAALPGVLAALP